MRTDKFYCPYCMVSFVIPMDKLPQVWQKVNCDYCKKSFWLRYPNGWASRLLTTRKKPPKLHLAGSKCHRLFGTKEPALVECKNCQRHIIKRLQARGWRLIKKHARQVNILMPPEDDKRYTWTTEWLWFGDVRIPSFITMEDL